MIAYDPSAALDTLGGELDALDWLGGARRYPGPLRSLIDEAWLIRGCSDCQRRGGLALELAAKSRDLVLLKLVGLALLVMCPSARNSSPRETIAAARWWRVWAHLKAVSEARYDERDERMTVPGLTVPILNEAWLGPGDRFGRILAWLADNETVQTRINGTPLFWVDHKSGTAKGLPRLIPPRRITRFLEVVARYAGKAWVHVLWLGSDADGVGWHADASREALEGWREPVEPVVFRLPSDPDTACIRVRRALLDAEDKMRAYVRRPDRLRLQDYGSELAAYLARHGHGALLPRSERAAFAVIYPNGYTGDSYEDSPERRALRADAARAVRLIAAPPGQPG